MAAATAPSASQSARARTERAGGEAARPPATQAATSRQGAATARRAQPTRSGPAASRAASVMVAPVVPHEIAAAPMRRRPMSIEPVVYGSGDGSPVGFIGLGKMGGPMAERLLARGHALVVHDAVATAAEPLL